jgi:hypothetical protein
VFSFAIHCGEVLGEAELIQREREIRLESQERRTREATRALWQHTTSEEKKQTGVREKMK